MRKRVNGYCPAVFLVNKKISASRNRTERGTHEMQFLHKAVIQSVNNCCINHWRIHSELNGTQRHHDNLISYFFFATLMILLS